MMFPKRFFGSWLNTRLAQVRPDKTLAVLVDKSELTSIEFLKHHTASDDFCKDLILEKKQWIYWNGRRMLVLLHDPAKNKDQSTTDKQMRELGVSAC